MTEEQTTTGTSVLEKPEVDRFVPEARLRVLVTGGAGFIGHHIVRHLGQFSDVFVIDKLTYAARPERLNGIPHMKHDIADGIPDSFGGFDVVIHTAAETHVDRSLVDAREFIRSNVQGTQQILEWIRKQERPPLLLHFSTDEVYGEAAGEPFLETDPLNPGNPYAASKVGAEAMCRAYEHTYGLPIIIVRPTNTYGWGQYPEKFIPTLAHKKNEGVILMTRNGKYPTRMWLHVEDLCDAIDVLIWRGELGTYNISGDEEISTRDVLDMVGDAVGVKIPFITSDTARPGVDVRYSVDDSKLRALGWKPKKTLRESLPEICKYI